MHRFLLLSALIGFLSSATISAKDKTAAPFIWPLKLPKQLSSGFADSRGGRFHMGIDLRTGGKEGAPVYAPEDGYVWRIKTSYNGYGKALYIRGKSGRLYVFGHLRNYNKEIGGYLRKRQLEAKRYYQDLYPKPEELKVQRGKQVANSGQTGAGAPHLHFEIRDGADRPTNPLMTGINHNDSIPPFILRLWLEYLDNVSLFGDSRIRPVTFASHSRTESGDTVVVQGRFGIKVAIEDRLGAGSFDIAPAMVRLRIDGKLYHEIRYDTLNFDENIFSLLDRDYQVGGERYKDVYNLYRKRGNRLSNYRSEVDGDGTFADTVSGFHTAVIEAADAYGNLRRRSFTFYYYAGGEILGDFEQMSVADSLITLPLNSVSSSSSFDDLRVFAVEEGKPDLTISITPKVDNTKLILRGDFRQKESLRVEFLFKNLLVHRYWVSLQPESTVTVDSVEYEVAGSHLICRVTLSNSSENELRASVNPGGAPYMNFDCDFTKVGERSFVALLKPTFSLVWANLTINGSPALRVFDSPMPYAFSSVEPLEFSGVTYPIGSEWYLSSDAGSTFDACWILTEPDSSTTSPLTGTVLSTPMCIDIFGGVFWRGMTLSLVGYNGSQEQHITSGLFRKKGDGWTWIGASGVPSPEFTISSSGTYALISDTAGPTIANLNIADGAIIKSSIPDIRCTITDELSGFEDDRNFDVSIDGKWLIPEYDPERNTLVCRTHWNLTGGQHVLKLDVHDRCGNHTVIERSFRIRAKAPTP